MLSTGAFLVALGPGAPTAVQARPDATAELEWRDVRELRLEGQGWSDLESPFDRLPRSAQGRVRKVVWSLSKHSAGIAARFVTDAPTLEVRWVLTSETLGAGTMPPSGASGVDLYVRGEDGWEWVDAGVPEGRENRRCLFRDVPVASREFLLYLPPCNGVRAVEVGVPRGTSLAAAAPRGKPLVFYGTSITQGYSASRPGMTHTAILGRWLDRPVINLGFSGNGTLELPLAELLGELDAAVYVLDCLPNMTAELVRQRTVPFVETLRAARPDTPILLVEDRSYANAPFHEELSRRNRESRAALRAAYEELREAGVPGLSYLEGDRLLGSDREDTVDGSHPSDLGFWRQAEAFRAALEPLLAPPG